GAIRWLTLLSPWKCIRCVFSDGANFVSVPSLLSGRLWDSSPSRSDGLLSATGYFRTDLNARLHFFPCFVSQHSHWRDKSCEEAIAARSRSTEQRRTEH